MLEASRLNQQADPAADVGAALDALIARGPLSVAFQPIVDLGRGEVAAYEVLGRAGPVSGPLALAAASPATLLDLAHRHGRLLALDRRWREIAISAIASHADLQHRFFINVDPRLAEYADASPGFTFAMIERAGLTPDRFVLELTEASSRDPAAIERVLEHYAEQGFRVALDDFGAGDETLAALLRLRPHIIKLDRRVIAGLCDDPLRASLLGGLVELGRRAAVAFVAEGIETERQLEAVRAAGITLGQGFLLGRPAARPEPLAAGVTMLLGHKPRRVAEAKGAAALPRDPSAALLRLAEILRGQGSLEAKLDHVARCAALALDLDRVSLRLLDGGRSKMLVAARSGPALHGASGADLAPGEGLAGWVVARGEPLYVANAERDPRFAAKPGQIAPIGSFLGVPLLGTEGTIGVLATSSPLPRAFTPEHLRWLRVIADLAAPYLDLARLSRVACTDPLTLALNRRALPSLIPDAAAEPLAVVLCDIDDFKQLNDRRGHAEGDEVLCAVTRIISSILRRGDRTVRLGGDELLIALPRVGLDHALGVAERVREAVASHEIGARVVVTVSVGVAERRPGEDRDSLLGRADAALYRAKALGKNRVVADAWSGERLR